MADTRLDAEPDVVAIQGMATIPLIELAAGTDVARAVRPTGYGPE